MSCPKLPHFVAECDGTRADMDSNCGDLISGTPMTEISQRIFEAIIRYASGEKVRSEELGYGNDEFLPWQVGAVM